MTSLSSDAQRHLDETTAYCAGKSRPGAIRNLVAAVRRGMAKIERTPSEGSLAPRPYTDTADSVIIGIYHEAADIPHRM